MKLSQEQITHMMSTMTPSERKSWVQADAYKRWIANQYRGTLEMATGTGKTRIAVMAVAKELESNPDATIYISVPTETLRDVDWPDEFKLWGYEHLLPKVNIICHVSMAKVKEEEIDLFVWDENHKATPSNAALFSNIKVYKVLGLTATLPTVKKFGNAEEKLNIINELCPSIYKVTLEQGISLGLIADFEVKVMMFDLDKTDMYIKGGTKARPIMTTEAARYAYLTKMLQKCMYNPKLEGAKFAQIQKRTALIRNLKSKEKLAKKIMKLIITPENRTLIFCGSIEQSKELCGENIFNSETDITYLSKFQSKEINYCGVVDALNEGKNIQELDQSLVVQLNSNERTIIQRIGRNVRYRQGHKALIVVLVARNTCDEKWYKSAFENFDKSRITEYYVKVD